MPQAKPYIGVTGFMNRDEVRAALEVVPADSDRQLMVGVLMSLKTLRGQTNRWPGRYPEREAVSEIFVDDPKTLNLIHFSTDESLTLSLQLNQLLEIGGPNLDGFQLNMVWPSIGDLEDFSEAYPNLTLILQIGVRAIKEVGSTEAFAEMVGHYVPTISGILLDPSGGRGREFNPNEVIPYLRAARQYPTLGLGVAGGLGPSSLSTLETLQFAFPHISIDAESRLRKSLPDDLDREKVRSYLTQAYQLFSQR